MKKLLVIVLALILVLLLAGCGEGEEMVLGESKTYSVSGDIHSLKLWVNAADMTVVESDSFSVESNLKYLTVSEDNGVLSVTEKVKLSSVTYTDAALTLYVPAGTEFERLEITTGAAKLTAGELSAQKVKLQLGAGDVKIETLNASGEAEIRGGAGKITVSGGALNDLDLEMGAGELNLTTALLGSSDLSLGFGASNLTLLGSKDDYRIDVEKGVGAIFVDGVPVSEVDRGTGENRLEIEGGVGAINLKFQEKET